MLILLICIVLSMEYVWQPSPTWPSTIGKGSGLCNRILLCGPLRNVFKLVLLSKKLENFRSRENKISLGHHSSLTVDPRTSVSRYSPHSLPPCIILSSVLWPLGAQCQQCQPRGRRFASDACMACLVPQRKERTKGTHTEADFWVELFLKKWNLLVPMPRIYFKTSHITSVMQCLTS